jgi:hypothetical protein
MKRIAAGLPLLLLALACLAADAPRHIVDELPSARLVGSGPYRYFGLRIYDAALWSAAARPDDNSPFALDLCYARSLDGKRIAAASADEMRKVGRGSSAQRNAWLADMARLFPDVRDGDCITGLYRPGSPTRFLLNGKALGEVADPAFGPAFFAIWLSPATSAPELRARLLGSAGG